MAYEHGVDEKRLPAWLRRPIARPGHATAVAGLLDELQLNTVCQSAKCPNRGECFSDGTATFLVGGDVCTRGCTFCAVSPGSPAALDPGEAARVAEAAQRLGLSHVVVTMVTRDDLDDGAAAHVAAVVRALRVSVPDATVEVLTSDFAGSDVSVDAVCAAYPDVFNHNLETVPRLYAQVRPEASLDRSLRVLTRVKEWCAQTGARQIPTKSGLMLGLGETHDEVVEVMVMLREVGCDMLTLGQYLRPSPEHLAVAEFLEPAEFADLEREARRLGFVRVASAPFVRSSYHAHEMVSTE